MTYECIAVSDVGNIRTLTLDRPRVHNALSLQTIDEIGAAVREVEAEERSILIITGAGERTFCAGGDLVEFSGLKTREAAMEMSLRMQRVSREMRRSSAVIIAAMNGDAYGGGLEFALGADIRIATETARMAFYQITLGITPAWRGISRALDVIPRSRALMLLTTGERFNAEAAAQWGLIDTVAPARGALEAALQLAAKIEAHPARAVRAIKRMVDATRDDEEPQLLREAADFADTWLSDEHWAALAARKSR
ncbi:MAG: enoyl-CoA hydratase/isomerase family protein [Candidatus Velthaea sp.]